MSHVGSSKSLLCFFFVDVKFQFKYLKKTENSYIIQIEAHRWNYNVTDCSLINVRKRRSLRQWNEKLLERDSDKI